MPSGQVDCWALYPGQQEELADLWDPCCVATATTDSNGAVNCEKTVYEQCVFHVSRNAQSPIHALPAGVVLIQCTSCLGVLQIWRLGS